MFVFLQIWMIAKANHVSTMQLVTMKSTHLPVNVPLDGLGNYVIQVNANKKYNLPNIFQNHKNWISFKMHFFISLSQMWMIVKTTNVKIMQYATMESIHSAVNAPLDGLENFVNQVTKFRNIKNPCLYANEVRGIKIIQNLC